MKTKWINNEIINSYNDPYHIWPIETFLWGNNINDSIVPFVEATFRYVYSRELHKGYVWDVSEVTARDMTPEESWKEQREIILRKTEYQNNQLEKFEENYRKLITSY